jgi:steroid delta-isomerase-like uncharacterized protein
MSTEELKAIARRYIEEVWNKGNLALIDELFTPDHINHSPSAGQMAGPEGLKQLIASFRNAAPDLHFTIDDMIAEGDRVVTRWTARGTHAGELMGVPPTGKQITVTAIVIDRFAGGKFAEHWAGRDDLGLYQQLGLIPSLEPVSH